MILELLVSHAFAAAPQFSNTRVLAPRTGTNVTAGFAKIENSSEAPIHVKLVELKPFSAVEMHETKIQDGMAKMSRIDQLTIAAKQTFELKPGGAHLMLFDAKRALSPGEKLSAVFEVDGQRITVPFNVVPH